MILKEVYICIYRKRNKILYLSTTLLVWAIKTHPKSGMWGVGHGDRPLLHMTAVQMAAMSISLDAKKKKKNQNKTKTIKRKKIKVN